MPQDSRTVVTTPPNFHLNDTISMNSWFIVSSQVSILIIYPPFDGAKLNILPYWTFPKCATCACARKKASFVTPLWAQCNKAYSGCFLLRHFQGGANSGYRPGRRFDPSGIRMGGSGYQMHGPPPSNHYNNAPPMGGGYHGPLGPFGGRGSVGGGGPAVSGLLPVPPRAGVGGGGGGLALPPPTGPHRQPQGTYSAGGLLVLGPSGGGGQHGGLGGSGTQERASSPPNMDAPHVGDDEYDPERPAMDNVSSHIGIMHTHGTNYGANLAQGQPMILKIPPHAMPPPPPLKQTAQLAPPPLQSGSNTYRDNGNTTGRGGGRGSGRSRGGGASGGKRPQSNVLDLNFIPEKDNTVAKLYRFFGKHGNIRHIRVGELSNGTQDPQVHYRSLHACFCPSCVLHNTVVPVLGMYALPAR